MEWKEWMGKRIFVRLKTGKVFSGVVKDVDFKSVPVIFISIIDKFGMMVSFSAGEIIEIKEEVEE